MNDQTYWRWVSFWIGWIGGFVVGALFVFLATRDFPQ